MLPNLMPHIDVSRETIQLLEVYESLLRSWQGVKNLVGPSTVNELWGRHFADSAQLLRLCPNAKRWVDLGSGAGFPGLVIAIFLKKTLGAHIDLIESDHRKCAFLRTVARETGAPASVHCGRIEDILPNFKNVDVLTARALADMEKLLAWTGDLIQNGATGLFLKGQDVANELTIFSKYSSLTHKLVPSLTDPRASIVKVSSDVTN